MSDKNYLGASFSQLWESAQMQLAQFHEASGDVPGWVMVTLMTAGLVVALSAAVLPALTQLFNDAISSVTATM